MTEFPPIAAPDAGGRRAGAGPPGHVDETGRVARAPRGAVGVGGGMPGGVPAATSSSARGWWCSRAITASPPPGVSAFPAGGHRADGRQLRRRWRRDQRARRDPRARPCAWWTSRSTSTSRISPSIGAHKVRRGSGNIAVEDALTARRGAGRDRGGPPDRRRGGRCGRRPADRRRHGHRKHHGRNGIDRRADRRRAGRRWSAGAPGSTTPDGRARSRRFATRCTAARGLTADPVGLLRVCGGADLAAMAGFCAQAAVRRTPVLLDGVVVTAAAMVAERARAGCPASGGGRAIGPPNPRTRWPWRSWNSNRSSIFRCGSARAPAQRSRCRSCGPRSPRCASMATFDEASVSS